MAVLNRMKIGARLSAGFALLLLMTLVVVTIGWLQLRAMHRDFMEVTVDTLPSILLSGDMRADADEVRRNQIRLVSEADVGARKRIVSDINDTRGLLKTLYDTYGQSNIQGDQERQLWKTLGVKLEEYEKLSVKIEVLAQADPEGDAANAAAASASSDVVMIAAAPADAASAAAPAPAAAEATAAAVPAQPASAATALKPEELSRQLQEAVYGDAFSAFAAVQDKLDKLKAINLQRSREAEARGNATFSRSQIVVGMMAAGSLALGVLLSLTLTRSVVVPLGNAVAALRRIADGGLDQSIDIRGKDELSLMLHEMARMQDHLCHVVRDIRASSESVSTSSGEIASGNLDLSMRTEEQAAQLEETAASMEQLTATVKHSAETARQVDQLAGLASTAARHGAEVVGQVVSTMDGIQKSSDKISEIISVIDGIAFQTNILALNAAVEAARAGEQGRGFAVVAAEVRGLAQRSASAAKEIKILISDSAGRVKGGSRLVDEAGRSMEDIRSQITKVTGLVGAILSAVTEQGAGIQQINEAVGQLDQATQQNAALVEQASAASESLAQQALRLVEAVSVFRTGDNAGGDGYRHDDGDGVETSRGDEAGPGNAPYADAPYGYTGLEASDADADAAAQAAGADADAATGVVARAQGLLSAASSQLRRRFVKTADQH